MGGCAHRRQYCQLILATLSVSTFIDDSPNNGGGGPGGATPENDRLGGGGGIRPGAIAIFLRKMLSPWGLQGSLRFRLRRKPQCGWIPPIAWKKISVILAEAEGRRRESRVAVPRSGSAMGVGDGKLHGGYAATLDSRATPGNTVGDGYPPSPGMTGWGAGAGFGQGLSQFSCGKCCRRGGFKAHCVFAFGESRNVDGYPHRLE